MHGTIESGCSVELRRLSELAALAPELRELAARAVAPNVFYEPAFMAASAPVFGHGVMAGLVWRRATPMRLIGFFPVTLESRRYGWKLPVLVGWTHPHAPLGTPLLDRDHGEEAVAAWLDHVAIAPMLPKLMLLPHLPADGDVAHAFDAALAHREGRSQHFALHQRAMLAPQGDRSGYLDHAMDQAVREELRRQRQQLADAGELTLTTTTDPVVLTAALLDLLCLETSGWKDRAGNAAPRNDAVHCFVAEAVSALAAEGKASVTRLALDGQAIAAIVTLRSGNAAWCWKIASDQTYSQSSPGMQLLLDVSETLLADAGIAHADSCAATDHPMLDQIWRERLALSDRLISVGPSDAAWFARVCKLESLRRKAVDQTEWLRDLSLQAWDKVRARLPA